LASMVLVSLQQATFSRADLPEAARRPYFLIIEEFPAFASSVTVEPFLNESRKFGVGLTLIAQTFACLDRGLLSSLRANCYTQLFFRLSPEDARIAVAGLNGEVKDLIDRDLVSLPIGTAMVMQGGGPPQRLRIDYRPVPDRLSTGELDIIERIRKNVGRPLDLSGRVAEPVRVVRPALPASLPPASANSDSLVAEEPLAAASPANPIQAAAPKTGEFVEGDA